MQKDIQKRKWLKLAYKSCRSHIVRSLTLWLPTLSKSLGVGQLLRSHQL